MSNQLLLRRRMLLASVSGGGGGGGNIAYRSGSFVQSGGGTFTVPVPAGVQAGDVMYAAFLQDTGTLPVLAGWTQLATGTTPTNTFPCTILRKVATGSEGTNYVFTSGASLGDCSIFALSGVNATPEDATTTVATGTATTIAYPSITTATANSWHLPIVCNFNAVAGTPGGYTARQSSGRWVIGFNKVIATAGAVTGVTSTGGGEWVAFSVAVRSS